jgi:hypothetical protein
VYDIIVAIHFGEFRRMFDRRLSNLAYRKINNIQKPKLLFEISIFARFFSESRHPLSPGSVSAGRAVVQYTIVFELW